MIDQKDIWKVARVMVKGHGDRAGIVAAQHLDQHLAEGDLVGRDVWKQILAAIQELQRVLRREDERVN